MDPVNVNVCALETAPEQGAKLVRDAVDVEITGPNGVEELLVTPEFERVVENDPLFVNKVLLLLANKRIRGVGEVVGNGAVGLVKLLVYKADLI